MSTKILFACAFTMIFAGSCAASNGGGHVVGNSIISAGVSKKMAEGDACDCEVAKKETKGTKKSADDSAAKPCDCQKVKSKDAKPACAAGDEACKK